MELEDFLEKVLDAMTTITAVPSQRQISLEGRVSELQKDYAGDLGALERRVDSCWKWTNKWSDELFSLKGRLESLAGLVPGMSNLEDTQNSTIADVDVLERRVRHLEERNDFHLAAAKKNAKKHVDLTALGARLGEVQGENNRLSVLYIQMAKKYASLTGRSHYLPETQEAEKTESLAVKNQGIQELSQHVDRYFRKPLKKVQTKKELVALLCEATNDYARRYPDYRGGEHNPFGDAFDQETIREVALLYIKRVVAPRVVENCAGTKERNYEAHPTYSIRENGEYWRGDKGRRLSYSTHDRAQARIERNNGHN